MAHGVRCGRNCQKLRQQLKISSIHSANNNSNNSDGWIDAVTQKRQPKLEKIVQ